MTVSVRPLSPRAYMLLLVVSMLLELVNSTIPLVLVVGSVTMLPTILIASTAVPRAIAFWVCSFAIAPGWAWWTQWRKIDRLLVCLIGSEIAYVFTMQARGQSMTPVTPLTNGWFLLDSVSHYFVLWGLCGHIRCMCKWFPWTKGLVFAYKLSRFYHATLFLVTQLVSTGLVSGGPSSSQTQSVQAAIAYFSVTMVLLHQLFALVLLTERALRVKRDQEASRDGEHTALLNHNVNHDGTRPDQHK